MPPYVLNELVVTDENGRGHLVTEVEFREHSHNHREESDVGESTSYPRRAAWRAAGESRVPCLPLQHWEAEPRAADVEHT